MKVGRQLYAATLSTNVKYWHNICHHQPSFQGQLLLYSLYSSAICSTEKVGTPSAFISHPFKVQYYSTSCIYLSSAQQHRFHNQQLIRDGLQVAIRYLAHTLLSGMRNVRLSIS
jgi:hypothetical protein